MLDLMVYYRWYLTLNGILYYGTHDDPLNYTSVLTTYNGINSPREIKEMYFYYKSEGEVICIKKGSSTSPEQRLALIHPSIKKEDLEECVHNKYTAFMLSSSLVPPNKILQEHLDKLSTPFHFYSLVSLPITSSNTILDYFFSEDTPILKLILKYHTSHLHRAYITSCLVTICLCVLSIFYLVCGIYSVKNPIVTEFELNRFRIVKYREVGKKEFDSCLICFDAFQGEDEVRVLLCKHYFHKDCVDKWLCEQSSRCPYCRCTNKLYEEIV